MRFRGSAYVLYSRKYRPRRPFRCLEQISADGGLLLQLEPGALPHWAKEFEHVPGIDALAQERLGARLTRFRAALKGTAIDPSGMFVNDLVRRVFGF